MANNPTPTGEVAIAQERQINFYNQGGHDHDGQNSTPVKLLPGQVSLSNLDPSLIDYLKGGSSSNNSSGDQNLIPIPDLTFSTNAISPGGYVTGTTVWAGMAVVRYLRIIMSIPSEIRITFYHKPTFADEDREFRAENCGDKFMWEGNWAHYDETATKSVFWKIENTGLSTTQVNVVLKSAVAVANTYAAYMQSLGVQGSTALNGAVTLIPGNGISLTEDTANNTIRLDAGPIQTLPITQWSLTPIPISATFTNVTVSNIAYLLDGITTDYNHYCSWTNSGFVGIDLGAVYTVGRIQLLMYFGDQRYYKNVKLEGSADQLTWVTLKSASNYKPFGIPLTVEIPRGMNLRYIRAWSNGSSTDTTNHVIKIIPYVLGDKS